MRRVKQRGPGPMAMAGIVIVIVVIGTYLAFAKEVPFRHHYTVHAAFKNANGIRKNSPVRIAGVTVGKVAKIRFLNAGEPAAELDLRLDKKGLPLHRDAQLTIRPRIFLEGNFFVDLKPGSPSAPTIGDGDTVPVNQTSTPVQLDQILTTLQTSTRQDLQVLLHEYSESLRGSGARGFNRSIPFWTPAYRDSAIVNQATLGVDQHDLSGYIAGAGKTAAALDRDGPKLQSLVTDFNTTAGALAFRQNELRSALGELPRTLATAMPALRALDEAFPPVRQLVAALRPATRSTGPAIDASLPLVRQLRGAVSAAELRGLTSDLRPTVTSLAGLQTASVPLYNQVRAASSCQNKVILPWSRDKIVDPDFPATGQVFQDSLKSLPGLAGESRSGDANGQWFRVFGDAGVYAYPTGQDRFMLTQRPIGGVNPPQPPKRTPLRSDVACETQEPPDLRTIAGPPPAGQFKIAEAPAGLLAKGQAEAVKWLRNQVKREGLGDQLKVVGDALDASQVRKLGK